MALAEARGCLMSNVEMSAVQASKAELDHIEGIQGNFICGSFMAKLNESTDSAIKVTPEDQPALSHMKALKERLNLYNETVQTKNKELMETLKAITQTNITADDECLRKLKTLEDEERLTTISCDIAVEFQRITNEYIQNVTKAYESYKRDIIPHLDNINMNGDAILLDIAKGLIHTPDQTCGVVDYFINMSLNNFSNDAPHQESFKRTVAEHALAANNQYKELDQQIANSFPYRSGRFPQQ